MKILSMKGIIFKGFLGFQTDEFKNKSFGGSRNNYYYDGYEEMNHGGCLFLYG